MRRRGAKYRSTPVWTEKIITLVGGLTACDQELRELNNVNQLTMEASAWPVCDKTARFIEKTFRRCFAEMEPPHKLILHKGRKFMNERATKLLSEWKIVPH